MRPTPQLSVKTGGVGSEGVGGGGTKVGEPTHNPLLIHAYLKGGCVFGGMEACL